MERCQVIRQFVIKIKDFDKAGLLYKLKQNGVWSNLLETLTDFLKEHKQKIDINWQSYLWLSWVLSSSILSPLQFLTYINNLLDSVATNAKIFEDDTSLFHAVQDITPISCDLNYDLNRIKDWVYHRKSGFNVESTKQAQEIIFTQMF